MDLLESAHWCPSAAAGTCRSRSKRPRRTFTSRRRALNSCWASRGARSPCNSTRCTAGARVSALLSHVDHILVHDSYAASFSCASPSSAAPVLTVWDLPGFGGGDGQKLRPSKRGANLLSCWTGQTRVHRERSGVLFWSRLEREDSCPGSHQEILPPNKTGGLHHVEAFFSCFHSE